MPLADLLSTASIGGTSGLIEGNPELLLLQLYGGAVKLRPLKGARLEAVLQGLAGGGGGC